MGNLDLEEKPLPQADRHREERKRRAKTGSLIKWALSTQQCGLQRLEQPLWRNFRNSEIEAELYFVPLQVISTLLKGYITDICLLRMLLTLKKQYDNILSPPPGFCSFLSFPLLNFIVVFPVFSYLTFKGVPLIFIWCRCLFDPTGSLIVYYLCNLGVLMNLPRNILEENSDFYLIKKKNPEFKVEISYFLWFSFMLYNHT